MRAAVTIPNIFGQINFLEEVAPNTEEQEELENIDSEIKRNAEIKSILNMCSDNQNTSNILSSLKRLEGLRAAIMIDHGKLQDAKEMLSSLSSVNDYKPNEKDTKLLITSLLGILKRNYGSTNQEREEGLELLESARLLGEEIKLQHERINWFQL